MFVLVCLIPFCSDSRKAGEGGGGGNGIGGEDRKLMPQVRSRQERGNEHGQKQI